MPNKFPPNHMEPKKNSSVSTGQSAGANHHQPAPKMNNQTTGQSKQPVLLTPPPAAPAKTTSEKQPFISRKNWIIGAILVILIVFAYSFQGPLKKWQNKLGNQSNIFYKLVTSDVDRIEISGSTARTFEKKGDKWIVSGTKDFPVKNDIVAGFLNDLDNAKSLKMTLVSTEKDKKAEFNAHGSGVEVKLYQGDKMMLDFVVGKNTSDFSGAYVSRPDLNDTFSVEENLHKYIDQPDWRDNVIFSSDSSALTKLRFQYPNRSFTIEKKDGKWAGVMPYGFTVNQDKAEKIAAAMSNLSATDIPEQTFAGTGLEKHIIIVQATGEGVDNTIMVGTDNKQGLYFAKRADSDNIYLISKINRDALDKTIGQMR